MTYDLEIYEDVELKSEVLKLKDFEDQFTYLLSGEGFEDFFIDSSTGN